MLNYRIGYPIMAPYTPSGAAVSAGDVVVAGDVPHVAHSDIADGELGALAARGGVYEGPADGAINPGVKVYWDEATSKYTVTAAAGANTHFGFTSPDSSAAVDGDLIEVVHDPDGSAI